jgi:hypothetical protein
MRKPSGWILVAGAAATVVSAAFGLRLLDQRLYGIERRSAAKAGLSHPADEQKRVVLSPAGLWYYEGENSLRLTVEVASNRYIVYAWSPEAWPVEMPEWCRHRREEILPEIKRLTADRRIEWVEAR